MRAQKFLPAFCGGRFIAVWPCVKSRLAALLIFDPRFMPDPAVNPVRPDMVSSALADHSATTEPALPGLDVDVGASGDLNVSASLPRAVKPVQRAAANGRAPYGAPTLDLFADDTERATLQALNTDIRQCTLPGFELPEVFMAAVESVTEASAEEHLASIRAVRREPVQEDAGFTVSGEGPVNGELPLTSPPGKAHR